MEAVPATVMYNLVICETEPIAIEGLRKLLGPSDGFQIIAAESLPERAIESLSGRDCSLFLIDKAFGTRAVLDCLEAVRMKAPLTATVVWGTFLHEAESFKFFQAGAAGVVRKTASLETLIDCLRTVAAGGHWMERAVAPQTRLPRPVDGFLLTSREMQVVELLERGLRNKEIAVMLGICTGTVKIHLRHIFEKTGIHGRYGLALSCLQQKGLLADPVMEA